MNMLERESLFFQSCVHTFVQTRLSISSPWLIFMPCYAQCKDRSFFALDQKKFCSLKDTHLYQQFLAMFSYLFLFTFDMFNCFEDSEMKLILKFHDQR